ncbi:hypothetical protein D3P08_06070 [Paenibacillus nanensis]|uniref:Uncharacterized protein n=1 Tax=Paenibacillus nanensis TaxID=393251 RepID=A0A3A1VME9_9BACL|nr:hypothetical protein D3P08_06070 [Paenibacillus nanensis]
MFRPRRRRAAERYSESDGSEAAKQLSLGNLKFLLLHKFRELIAPTEFVLYEALAHYFFKAAPTVFFDLAHFGFLLRNGGRQLRWEGIF